MSDVPEVQYARTADGAHIAFQVIGDGPLDLVFLLGSGQVEVVWELPSFAPVFRRLASFSRLIQFDLRGSGLSDPFSLAELPSLEQQAVDMLAVLDAAGSEQSALVANCTGGLLAIFFAATYPQQVSTLVLDGCFARLAPAPDYPWGLPKELIDRVTAPGSEHLRAEGRQGPLTQIAPTALRDPEFVAQWERSSRSALSPATARAFTELYLFADVRPALEAVHAPTLVLYRSGDLFAGRPHATYLAEHIRGATLVELPGDDNLIFAGDSNADLDEIEEFLTGVRRGPETDRVLATVLFTDIVGSTERAAKLGDRAWRDLLDRHDQVVRRQIERFRGREVNTAGDGFLATFDGPGRAIACACAIRDVVHTLGMEMRCGLHTGEIEVRGDDVAGMAVHIGARVASCAGPGEVLVSATVKDLVVGSGIEFVDRGEHVLKGVPGTWRLFAVNS